MKRRDVVSQLASDLEGVLTCQMPDDLKKQYIRKTIDRAFYWGKTLEKYRRKAIKDEHPR